MHGISVGDSMEEYEEQRNIRECLLMSALIHPAPGPDGLTGRLC